MTRPNLPGPRGLPLLGSLPWFARDPLGFVQQLHDEHGDLAYFRLALHDVVLVSHPDAVAEVLKRRPDEMHKDAIYELIRPLLGNGLVTAEGDHWKRHRSLAAPSFSKKHVQGYADTMAKCTRDHIADFREGETRDLHDDMMEITQQIALDTLFGGDLDLDLGKVGPAIGASMEAFSYESQGLGRILPPFVPTSMRRRAKEAIADLDAVIFAAIEARRAKGLGDDLLSRLLEARDDDGRGFDDTQLRDEAVTLFVAGHETTALALTYTWLLLGTNPDALAWVQEEVDAVLDGPATAEHMRALPRTEAAIKEAMRLIPPVWGIGRDAQIDVEVGGAAIPKGTQLLVCQWVLHHDARFFPDPMLYKPERWLDGSTDALPKMAYLPFGGGPRVCIGNHFAMLEAVLALAEMVKVVQLEPLEPVPPPMLPSITLRPIGPVPVVVHLR